MVKRTILSHFLYVCKVSHRLTIWIKKIKSFVSYQKRKKSVDVVRSGIGDAWGIGAGPRWARVALRVSGPGLGSLGRGEAGGRGYPSRCRDAPRLNNLSEHTVHRSCQTQEPLSRPPGAPVPTPGSPSRPSRWAAALRWPRSSLLRPQKSQDPGVCGDCPALEMSTFKTHSAGQTPHTHRWDSVPRLWSLTSHPKRKGCWERCHHPASQTLADVANPSRLFTTQADPGLGPVPAPHLPLRPGLGTSSHCS